MEFFKDLEFFRDFFALYKSLPCLWNKSDPKYDDEYQKDLSMMDLAKKYRTRSPNATQVDIRNKLEIFTKCLQKEYKRYLKKGSTANSELWYYKDLSFLLDDCRSKRAVIQGKKLQSKKAVKQKVVTKNNQTPNDGKETPMHTNVAAAKKPSVKDKYDKVTEKLKSLPTEQFSFIENILENIYKFAHHENQELMDDDLLANTISQEAPQPIAANKEIVQVAQSTTVDTQMTSVHANLNCPCRSNPPNMFTSSTITSRQDAPQPIIVNTETVQAIQTNINHSQITSVQTNLNSLSGPNSIITRRPEEPQSIAANMETVQGAQSNTVDTQMTYIQTNLNRPCSPNSPEQDKTIQSESEIICLSD